MYWCRTIGQLALYADPAQTVPLVRAGKSLAILAYLGLRPQRCDSRDRVAALFWPDAPPRDAHHALRQARYRLRQAVPADLLVEGQENLLCCCECVAFDCLEGERALAAGDPERAFELLRGNFLEGFGIAESREFEHWLQPRRSRLSTRSTKLASRCSSERSTGPGRPAARSPSTGPTPRCSGGPSRTNRLRSCKRTHASSSGASHR
jgi:DNA-binding SARP family transcriptional activator